MIFCGKVFGQLGQKGQSAGFECGQSCTHPRCVLAVARVLLHLVVDQLSWGLSLKSSFIQSTAGDASPLRHEP